MATERAAHSAGSTTMLARVVAGLIGGLAGGVVFGVLMSMTGMMSMVAMLVGSSSVAVGWLVHLAISAFVGITFALILSALARRVLVSMLVGLGYGAVWWVLGGLILMPARLGMDVFMLDATTMQSLIGHLLYGLALGLVYALVAPRLHRD